ncbi:MAG: pyridoxamine 5'-phosphate oxidase family protein [Planctomycetes bacterium]|nr:pyridoxamine 5'-phosphate oxidase family protein [Planctomycetota bacterium]
MTRSLSAELVDFVQSGVSVQIGTRDASLVPEAVRGVGARVEPDRGHVVVFVPAATGTRTLANLEDNGRIAICFSRIADNRTIQLKGRARSVAAARDEDRAVVDRYRGELAQNLAFVGMPPRLSYRISSWPCHAVRVEIETIWVQTPGPGAGEALGQGVDA